jgi:CRISPR/Cas system-associated exonuclease Cas4 (RecB family)
MKSLSWNSLSAFLKCPLQLKFKIDKVEYPQDSRNAILGVVIQKLFELWINEEHFWDGPSWLHENAGRVWLLCQEGGKPTGGWASYCPWESMEQSHFVWEDCLLQIDNLFGMITEHQLLAKVQASEFKFNAKLPSGESIRGSIDFMLDGARGKYILDAKGTRYKNKYLDKRQLIFYKLGMVLEHGDAWREAETAWLIYRDKLYESVPVSDSDLKFMSDLCMSVYADIKAEKFDATPGDSCKFCDYKGTCPVLNTGRVNDKLFEV